MFLVFFFFFFELEIWMVGWARQRIVLSWLVFFCCCCYFCGCSCPVDMCIRWKSHSQTQITIDVEEKEKVGKKNPHLFIFFSPPSEKKK